MSLHSDDLPAYVAHLEAELSEARGLLARWDAFVVPENLDVHAVAAETDVHLRG